MGHNSIPPLRRAPLPVPPAPGIRSFFLVAGPAAILLGTSIGSGEWLIGPAAVVQYGTALLGIVTVSVLLQVVFNTELMRYTVSTGEPIFTGFMRLGRRPVMWGMIYIIFGFLHLGWPGVRGHIGVGIVCHRQRSASGGWRWGDGDVVRLFHVCPLPRHPDFWKDGGEEPSNAFPGR